MRIRQKCIGSILNTLLYFLQLVFIISIFFIIVVIVSITVFIISILFVIVIIVSIIVIITDVALIGVTTEEGQNIRKDNVNHQ